MTNTIKPFIKWVGGKTQILPYIRKKYPSHIIKYCEPFVGGGAVLFDILANFHPQQALINDINSELINLYLQIQNNPESLISKLSVLQNIFWNSSLKERKDFFYSKRDRYNQLLKFDGFFDEKAILFIFLNKTCFNGLYRVNSKGFYNVPMGSYKKPLICDAENIRITSSLLSNVIIQCGDYRECENFIDDNTFVYIDPPYRPLTQTSSFTSYSAIDFSDHDQIELSKFIYSISKKGAYFIASNSDPKNVDVNDNFFDDIYDNFSISRIIANRMINCNSSRRSGISELLISNY